MPDTTSGQQQGQVDTITILTTRGPSLAKTWKADGSIEGHGKAKQHTLTEHQVASIDDVAQLIHRVSRQHTSCLIRGRYIGDEHAAQVPDKDNERLPGFVLRQNAYFTDEPLHTVAFDVDHFEPMFADPLSDPAAACDEFISAHLPPEFHGVTYVWQLSGSAGHPSKSKRELRARLYFWLADPMDSDQMHAWASLGDVPVDRAVFQKVQAIYTAAPVLEAGMLDPVKVRFGAVRGKKGDVVHLNVDPVALAVQMASRPRSRYNGNGELIERTDPRTKRGLVGAVCRAFPHVRDVLLDERFEGSWREDSERRWSWTLPGHPAEGGFVDESGLYFVSMHDSAPADSHKIALNSYDLFRVYNFGHLDEAVPKDEQWPWHNDPTQRPSDAAMRRWARQLPEVQREMAAEREQRAEDELQAEMAAEMQASMGATITATPTATPAKPAVTRLVEDESEPQRVAMVDRVKLAMANCDMDSTEISQTLNDTTLRNWWRNGFYSPITGRLLFLNSEDQLLQFGPADWQKQLQLAYGPVLDHQQLLAAAQRIATARGQGATAGGVMIEIKDAVWHAFTLFVKHHRQRSLAEYQVDMFVDSGYVAMTQTAAVVVQGGAKFKLHQLSVPAITAASIVAEYKSHLKDLDTLIDSLLYARFATDRRLAFDWLKGGSSIGKGFFTQGVLGRDGLNIVCELSTKEVEAALEGKPVGIAVEMINGKWVILVDEFKSAKGELKQLNNTFTASPKNQLRFTAPLYSKWFTSAEGVDSLAGNEGVEAQFAERFCFFNLGTGRLDDLPLFKQHGKMTYRDVIINYVAQRLNDGIDQLRLLGRAGASKAADEWLEKAHKDHGIDNTYTRLEDNVDGWAEELRQLITDYSLHITGKKIIRRMDGLPGQLKSALAVNVAIVNGCKSKHGDSQLLAVVRRPGAVAKAWINTSMPASQAIMVGHKATAIVDVMAGGDVSKPFRWYEDVDGGTDRTEHKAKAVVLTLDAIVSDFSNVVAVDFFKGQDATE